MKEKLRLVRTLLEKRQARRKEQRFVVEGPHLVEEAAEQIDFAIYAEELPIISQLKTKGVACYKISRKQFSKISEVETPQWVLAVVKEKVHTLDDILRVKDPLIVFCAGVQDPGNLGTIIRTADAVGAAGVVLSRGTVDLYNGKVIRATMGSLFHLPVVQAEEIEDTIGKLKKRQVKVIASDVSAKKDLYAIDYKGPVAILVGNEGAGLEDEIIKQADEAIRIPMPGKAESLNVGISTSVILYEALRQRNAG